MSSSYQVEGDCTSMNPQAVEYNEKWPSPGEDQERKAKAAEHNRQGKRYRPINAQLQETIAKAKRHGNSVEEAVDQFTTSKNARNEKKEKAVRGHTRDSARGAKRGTSPTRQKCDARAAPAAKRATRHSRQR